MPVDLRTTYLGFELPHPVVASASPLSQTLDGIRRLEDGGAAAIVMASLFEEQLRHEQEAFEHLVSAGGESYSESLSYFPMPAEFDRGPWEYLDLVRCAREAIHVPLIASLNCVTSAGWSEYARQVVEAGAQAIELNIFFLPGDPDTPAREIESRYVSIVQTVSESVSVPVAVKLSPYFSAMGEMARLLCEAGASGLVLFNRFYQPDFDLDQMQVVAEVELSRPLEIRLPLLWIALLHGKISASLAATSGVETFREVAKYLLAGADAVMTTSSLLRHGPERIQTLVDDLRTWMEERDYESVRQLQGSMSQGKVRDPAALVRANYVRMLQSYRHPFLR